MRQVPKDRLGQANIITGKKDNDESTTKNKKLHIKI